MPHTPVLLEEVLEILDPQPGDFVIDGTIGGGGHATAIAEKIGPNGKLLGVDWDEETIKRLQSSVIGYQSNATLVCGNYADMPEILKERNLPKADGLLLDLGFSSEQLESSGRGFSFSPAAAGEPLLMTYDNARPPVKELLRQMSEKELADVIFTFGGERMSRRIAKAIKEYGRKKKIETSGELASVVRSALPANYERGRIDRATRTFQALRIYANDELGNLEKLLGALPEIVKKDGRVAIISFHSLEDALVKNTFRTLKKNNVADSITKKPIVASREEIVRNPRSRSAKLRGAIIL